MSDAPRRSIDSLKKEAKRWLRELEHGEPAARARYERAVPDGVAPTAPTLRDVQHALAREHGFPGWTEFKQRLEADGDAGMGATAISLARYEDMADALRDAYLTGTPAAMERHWRHTWHRRAWSGMRTYVQLDLGLRPSGADDDLPITLDDARTLVAREHGFNSWSALAAYVAAPPPRGAIAAKPVRVVATDGESSGTLLRSREWAAVLQQLRESRGAALDAEGEMTDSVMRDVCLVDGVTELRLGGSKALTDEGIRHLARLPGLRTLDLGGTAITDAGLSVLRHLPALERISLSGTRITDAGAVHLAACEELSQVDLSWTRTGDGAIGTLAGKRRLSSLHTGNGVTDAGLAALQALPVFATWQGGTQWMALTSAGARPNYLHLRGTFTDRGMESLKRLQGLFGLNIDARELAITPAALAPLVDLPHLGWLAVDAVDASMPYIAAMPHLRYLGCQDTTAGDAGFTALSRSRSIEYIWGRDCHNLRRAGFAALAEMPALRSLSVSCRNVDDAGLAALPRFPALTELMPMGVPDEGYRHIGRCERMESLVLMYCRETTDQATGYLVGLPNLARYFASYTLVTDRTPELLSGIESLEEVTLDGCAGVTDAGIAKLARLPRLRKVGATGPAITPAVAAAFGPGVEVNS
jgi:hypothetical protein